MDEKALGLVETKGLVGAIEAADAMVKTAAVQLIGIENTIAALLTVKVVGETGAVKAAVGQDRAHGAHGGEVVGVRRDAVAALESVADQAAIGAGAEGDTPCWEAWERFRATGRNATATRSL